MELKQPQGGLTSLIRGQLYQSFTWKGRKCNEIMRIQVQIARMSIRSPLVGKTEYEKKPGLVPAIQRNPAQSWQYRETQLSTSNTEYEKKPGIVPAIQRNPAFRPGNIKYEIAVASGVFIWRDIKVKRKRKEKKLHIQLKAVKRK